MTGESDVRPWGHYLVLHRQEGLQIKRIEVDPGKRFSLQRHFKRSERWVVLSGEGIAMIGGDRIRVREGSYLEVPAETVHRMQNCGQTPLVFIEIQTGTYLGEDDIERLEDDFKRC